MHWIDSFDDLQLDIVGIIAVLGEASVTRNAQVTSLSWWSAIPRLLPAPQALLEHERKSRLPTAPGIVAGAYSGNIKKEINFFAQLVHPRQLEEYEVELVEVTRRKEAKDAFGAQTFGPLLWVSLLGFSMSIALVVLSVIYHDGFALLATIMLSMVSCAVGFGTRWELVFAEPEIKKERENKMPRSDVLIYYPNGAIRVIRPAYEEIARLYFQTEHARYKIDDTPYRTLALFSTIMLIAGVVSLANASNKLQVSFTAAYVLLNVLYWGVSALNPCRFHWKHAYQTRVLDIAPLPGPHDKALDYKGVVKRSVRQLRHDWHHFQRSWGLVEPARISRTFVDPEIGARTFTAALWTAIVLTGTAQWLNEATAIAPVNGAWKAWITEADSKVEPIDLFEGRHQPHRTSALPRQGTNWRQTRFQTGPDARDKRRIIIRDKIRDWKYDERLTSILAEHANKTRKPYPDETDETVEITPEKHDVAISIDGSSAASGERLATARLSRRIDSGAGISGTTITAGVEVVDMLTQSSEVEKGKE
ncbi:hypothetical protein PV08_05741 [Exophiala spinifera]|uniref:Uncharacterized protein n=1 Tax=Exophiala spinifera TaxID=91928 RepID=A0A0D1YKY5_9EURO|nr:uncharacterized protein PV08_05741 [Exophiala spinifera]KIW15691.1 hypothetical protein PV08_05741 [Exophiala spinifera]